MSQILLSFLLQLIKHTINPQKIQTVNVDFYRNLCYNKFQYIEEEIHDETNRNRIISDCHYSGSRYDCPVLSRKESTEKEKEEDLKQIEKISEEEKPETEEKSTKKESKKEVTKENEEEKELGTIGKSPNEKNEKENKEDIVSNENDNDNEVSNEETNS